MEMREKSVLVSVIGPVSLCSSSVYIVIVAVAVAVAVLVVVLLMTNVCVCLFPAIYFTVQSFVHSVMTPADTR